MPITRSQLAVHLPADHDDVECNVGAGKSGGCEAQDVGDGFVVTTGSLAPNTPVTVRTQLDLPVPERARAPWPLRFDPVLGPSVIALLLLLLVAAFAAWMGELTAARTREPNPQFPLMYAPPDAIGPAQGNYLLTEKVGTEAFVASIMQTAEKGATRLDRGGGWTITDTGQPAGWLAGPGVGVRRPGARRAGWLVQRRHERRGGQDAEVGAVQLRSATPLARQNGSMTTAGIGSFGGVMVVLGFVLAGFLALANPFGVSVVALIPGLFALFAFELLIPGSSTKRTAPGRELWSRLGGFRRILATPSAEDRFDFSGRKGSTPPTCRGPSPSGWPTPGPRSTASRPARTPRCRSTPARAALRCRWVRRLDGRRFSSTVSRRSLPTRRPRARPPAEVVAALRRRRRRGRRRWLVVSTPLLLSPSRRLFPRLLRNHVSKPNESRNP